MSELRDPRLDAAYAKAEVKLDAYYAKRRRRGPPILLATILALVLAVGVVATVDLRRLQSPRGTALAWTGAAVFGECTGYLELSVRAPAESRTDDELCQELRTQTAPNRSNSSEIGIDVLQVREGEQESTALMSVRRGGDEDEIELTMRRKGEGWAVLLSAELCRAIGCA